MAGGKLISTGVEFPDATTQTTSGLPLTGGTMTGTIAGFTSTGIDDNATSTAITIDASENVGIGLTPTYKLDVLGVGNNGLRVYAGTSSANQLFLGNTAGTSVAGTLTNQDFALIANGSQRLNVSTAGDVKVNTGNLVIGTSGKGIDFSAATPDGTGSTGSEVLDDYEEGTFTPTNNGDATGVFGGTTGEYTKVGNLVTVRVAFSVSTSFSSNSIGGLPFTSVGSASVSSVLGATPVFTESSDVNTFGRLQAGAVSVLFYSYTSNNNHAPSTTNNVYRFMLSYRAV